MTAYFFDYSQAHCSFCGELLPTEADPLRVSEFFCKNACAIDWHSAQVGAKTEPGFVVPWMHM